MLADVSVLEIQKRPSVYLENEKTGRAIVHWTLDQVRQWVVLRDLSLTHYAGKHALPLAEEGDILRIHC